MSVLWTVNPKRRKSRKHRSAAQRAATRRLVAMNKSRRNPARRRRARRSANPVVIHHTRRVSARRYRRNPSRRSSVMSHANTATVKGLLMRGVVGGAGAVLVDVGMGYASSFLPASMATPADATTGAPNYGYFGAKAALALALGIYGKRFTRHAGNMAEGALTVLAYQFIRPMVPAGIRLGYMNPAPTMRPRGVAGVGKYVSGTGAYFPSQRPAAMTSPGAAAARVVQMAPARRAG